MNRNTPLFSLAFATVIFSSLFADAADSSTQYVSAGGSKESKEVAPPAPAEATPDYYRFSFGLEVSDFGFGGTLGWRFSEYVGVRTGVDYFGFSKTLNPKTFRGADLHTEIQMLSEPVTIDFYPLKGNSLHFSAGLLVNQNLGFASATSGENETIRIDGTTYNFGSVGRLNISVQQNPVAPYLGFGGNLCYFDTAHHWALAGDLGVTYLGEASVTIDRTGGVGKDTPLGQSIQHSIDNEEGKVRSFGNYFSWAPVLRLGVTYSF